MASRHREPWILDVTVRVAGLAGVWHRGAHETRIGRIATGGRQVSLTAGSRLGPYEVVAPLGAGGMGEVYRGRDTRLDRSVAIKVLPGSTTKNRTPKQQWTV